MGALSLGSVPGADVVTLLDLVPGARSAADSGATLDEVFASYPAVLNIARLLQSLDLDADSSNGIQIPFEASVLAGSYASQLDFTDPQMFADDNAPAVQFICEVKQSRGASLCNSDDVKPQAEAELRDTEAQRNSGAPINRLPNVQVGADIVAEEGTSVTLSGMATDSDGSVASLRWQQTDRNAVPIDGNIALSNVTSGQASFVAPEVDEDRLFYFSLTATDNSGESSYDIIAVSVTDSSGGSNIPPTADAGADQTVTVGDTVILDGGNSADSDDVIATYSWEQIVSGDEPAVALDDSDLAQASFTAPAVEVATQLTFRLTVADSQGASSSDEQIVTVQPDSTPSNQPPTADAGEAQSVSSGDQVQLLGSGSDPDGDELSFLWEQQEGSPVSLENADQAQASFTAPEVDEQAVLRFKLTVSDGELDASSQVSITVIPPPVCEVTDPTTYPQCFIACTDGDVNTACPLPYEEFIPDDFSGFETIAQEFENCADMNPETLCLLPVDEFPGEPSELLGQLCEDVSDPQQCFTDGIDRLCSTFDPSARTPFCGAGADPSEPELPFDPSLLLGELCDDISNPQQCFSNGAAALCAVFDANAETPFCGESSDPTEPPAFPLDPSLLLGELCEDASDPQQCFAGGLDALCAVFDASGRTPFCGESGDPSEPPAFPLDPATVLGALCDDISDPQQCFANGVSGLCDAFDSNGVTPFCGEPADPSVPEFPFEPADLLGQLCGGSSDPQQCFANGVNGFCEVFDSEGVSPFCGEPSDPGAPPELPFDPGDFFAAFCDDSSDLPQCFADGVAGLCETFDPLSQTPFCGASGNPGQPPEFPTDPSELLGQLCADESDLQQCFSDGLAGLCSVFDSTGQTPFCGEPSDPPLDPEELFGALCDDVSAPQQCFAEGVAAFCAVFDPNSATPLCGDEQPSDPGVPPEFPLDLSTLLGQFCEDSSDLPACFAVGAEALCAAFDPIQQIPFCGEGSDPAEPPAFPLDPSLLLGQLCEDVSNPQQCFSDGVAGLCDSFDPNGLTPFCGEPSDPAEPPAFPLDPSLLLGQLCEDASDPQQCFTSAVAGLCETFDPSGMTPFCGEPSTPGEPSLPSFPFDPETLLGELCADASSPQQCFTEGLNGLCDAFDEDGATPFCGDAADPSVPEFPLDPAELLGQFCEDASNPQQCFMSGLNGLCDAFDAEGATPFCGDMSDPTTPPELPLDPATLLGQFCSDTTDLPQCFADGIAGLCAAFDPTSATPFCGGSADPAEPPSLPFEPGDLFGQLCDDPANIQQCFVDGFSSVCETFDPTSVTPFCGGATDPAFPPTFPSDPAELLGQLCGEFSDPAQCFAAGVAGFCEVFDSSAQTPFCGAAGEPGELPLDPAELLGALCADVTDPAQCFSDGVSGLCEVFDSGGTTPFCGNTETPDFGFDPTELVGQFCEDASGPEQCFIDGVNAVCEAFDPSGLNPFCGQQSFPLDPAVLLGQLCEDASQPEQCFASGVASLCNAFDAEGRTPFCGEGESPDFPLDPSVLLGQLCEDVSAPEQCFSEGVAGFCAIFDSNGMTPLCGDAAEPEFPSELPIDPGVLLGQLCGDASSPEQCFSSGVDGLCETFDPEGRSLFCGA